MAALVVATAPHAAAGTADLLWRPVHGLPLLSWPLRELKNVDALGFCGLIAPETYSSSGHSVLHTEEPSEYNRLIASTGNTWYRALVALCGVPAFCRWIVVIDAALPLVTADAIRAGLRAAERTGVAIAGEPVKETLKRVEGDVVAETLPRDALRRLVTPIVARRDALDRILAGYDPTRHDPNDLTALLRLAGVPVVTYDAGYPAVRVTSEDDLAIVETLLLQRLPEARPS